MKNTRKPGDGGRKPFRGDSRAEPRGDRPAPRKPYSPKPGPVREKNPDHVAVAGEGERISKIMARAGVASRRDCERMILEGRVRLNGAVLTTPAVNCTPADTIEVDGVQIGSIERTRLWIYYKPAGLVTTNYDPEGRPTVFDNLPAELPRVISVGRLDINTEGLLLLTNDGGLARMLELPTTGWLRRYRVRAYGEITQEKLDSLKDGIAVDGVFYGAIEATLDREQGHNVWITMGLREGKNREIKNVMGALGLDVNRLIRISYGPFQLGELEDGQVVEVKSRTLRDQLGPRLIAEANANFDAPLHEGGDGEPEPDAAVAAARGRPERPKRESQADRRERDLARIDTKRPERGERPKRERPEGDRDRGRGRDDDRKAGGREKTDGKPKRPPLGSTRTANVWMAPGARPVAVKKVKTETVAATPKRRVLRLKNTEAEAVAAAPEKRAGARRPARGERPEGGESTARAAAKPFRARSEGARPQDGRDRPVRAKTENRTGDDRRERADRPPRGDAPPGGGKAARGTPTGRADRPSRDSKPERGDRPARGEKPARGFAGKPEGKGPRKAPAKGPDGTGSGKDGPRKGGPGSRGTRGGADHRR
jgi:23S rRNA pseudouridine2605 synthase